MAINLEKFALYYRYLLLDDANAFTSAYTRTVSHAVFLAGIHLPKVARKRL